MSLNFPLAEIGVQYASELASGRVVTLPEAG
jgi:hypothetical protein